jgi:hypothetical protein
MNFRNKLECLSLACISYLVKCFYVRPEANRVKYLSSAPLKGRPHSHLTRLERLARDKHSSLLRKSVNYGRKKFYSTGPGRFKASENDEILESLLIFKLPWESK